MDVGNPVDKSSATEQYETLKYAYRSLDVTFDELTPSPELPDQVFVTDTGHIEGKTFIKANFKYPERKKEVEAVEEFAKGHHMHIHEFPQDVFFEGGDFIKHGDTYFFGWGKRSSHSASTHLNSFLDTEVVELELIDDYYYHLDTCFAPISKKVALVNMSAFTKEGINTLKAHFETLIPTSQKDNALLACNMVSIDGKAILTQGITNELKDTLRPYVELITTVPMTEFIKGGGSVHCVTQEIFD